MFATRIKQGILGGKDDSNNVREKEASPRLI